MDIGTLTGAIAIEDQLSGALNDLTNKVKQFAKDFEGTFGYLATGSMAAAAGVTAVTAAITALGMRGTEVNNLSASLERFTGSADNAAAVLEKMRAGTKGVVTDFELTERATKLLGGGVKLTADQFGTLGRAADVLSNQGLGKTKNMLELVSSAMLTGRARSLEMAIGRIDMEAAEKRYAASLNTTREDLTNVEKLEAHRAAILEALNKRIKEAGEGNRDFANTLERVIASVKNWLDKLAGIVATSPAVWRAIDAIGASFNRVFGGTSKTLLDNVVKGIEEFANVVAAAIPHIMDFFGFVADIIGKLWDWRDAIMAVAAAIIIYDGAVLGLGVAHGAMALGVEGVALALNSAALASIKFLAVWLPVAATIAGIAMSLGVAYNAFMYFKEGADHAASATENAGFEARNLATINERLGTKYTSMADAQKHVARVAAEVTAANAKQAAGAKALATENERVGRIAEEQAKKVAELFKTWTEGAKELDIIQAAMNRLTPAMRENHAILEQVVPALFKLKEAGRELSIQQLTMHATLVSQTLATNADMTAKLADIGVTEQMIAHNLELGVTLQDMAMYWAVDTVALEQYRAGLEKTLEASRGYAAFEAARMEDQRNQRKRAEEQAKQTNQALADLDREYQENSTAAFMTESEKKIAAIRKETAARYMLLAAGKTQEQQTAILAALARNEALAIDQVNLALEQEAALLANGPTQSDIIRDQRAAFDEVNQAATAAVYGGLATFFTTLGQVGGGSGNVGKFMQATGGIVAGLQSAHNWSQQVGKNNEKLGGSFGALSVVFNDNANKAQKWGAGLQAATGIAQGAIDIWNATAQSASTMQNSLSGAMAGAQAGAMFGPWGVAIGAAAGLVTGIVRGKPGWARAAEEVGRDFGVKISDELAKTIDEQAKKKFKGSRQASSIFSMREIIEEGGGVTDKNVLQYTEKLRDVFVMLEKGAFTSAQAMEVLDENFTDLVAGNTSSLGFWSDSLKEIIALNDKMGTQSKAIEAAIKQQAGMAIQGFNMIVAGSTKAREGYAKLRKDIEDTREEIKKLNEEPERGRGAEWTKKMEDAQKKLTESLTKQHKAGEGAIRELKDLGTVAQATFAVATAKGASFYEALQAAQPGLVGLRHAYEDLGLNIEDPFVKMLAVQSRLMENQPELIQGVQGLGASIAAMTNLNMLNADSFAAMGRLAADMYTRIQGEVAAAGGSTKDALMPMQDYLHAAARAAEELNLPLDEHTQMMIQQSKDLGIWKDQAPSAAEAMQAATEKLTTAIEALTLALQGIPSSLPDPFAGWEGPPSGPDTGFDEGGTVGRDWRKRSSRDVIPAWLRRGEVVVTPEQMQTPMMKENGGGSDGGSNGQPITVQLNVDGKKMTDVVINRLGGRLALGGIR